MRSVDQRFPHLLETEAAIIGLNEVAGWAANRSRGLESGELACSAVSAIGDRGLLSLHPRHAKPLLRRAIDHLLAGRDAWNQPLATRIVPAAVRWMEVSGHFPWGDDPARYLKDWRASSALRALAAELPSTGLMAEEVYGV